MKSVITFEGGYKAVIVFDPEIGVFRGEFVGLNGGADFYAKDIEGLRREGDISLNEFLCVCQEKGISPQKRRHQQRIKNSGRNSDAFASSPYPAAL